MIFKGMRMIQIGFFRKYENFSFSLRGGARGRFARFSENAKNSIYIYTRDSLCRGPFSPGGAAGGTFLQSGAHFMKMGPRRGAGAADGSQPL